MRRLGDFPGLGRAFMVAMIVSMGCYATVFPAQAQAEAAAAASEAVVPAHELAADFITDLTTRGVTELTGVDLDDSQRSERFRALLLDSFDVPYIGRFAIGTAWRRSSDAQRMRYLELFENYLVSTYAHRFREYQGEEILVTGSRFVRGPDSKVYSEFVSRSDADNVEVVWHVRRRDNGDFKIIDIEVGGVSMALTQRDDFSSVIRRGGGSIDSLISYLEERSNYMSEPEADAETEAEGDETGAMGIAQDTAGPEESSDQ